MWHLTEEGQQNTFIKHVCRSPLRKDTMETDDEEE